MSLEADVSSACQSIFSGRCYFGDIKGTVIVPYATFFYISDQPENNLAGFAGISDGWIQFDVYATTKKEARALAASVRAAINASGIRAVCTQAGRDMYDEETKLERVEMEFSAWH